MCDRGGCFRSSSIWWWAAVFVHEAQTGNKTSPFLCCINKIAAVIFFDRHFRICVGTCQTIGTNKWFKYFTLREKKPPRGIIRKLDAQKGNVVVKSSIWFPNIPLHRCRQHSVTRIEEHNLAKRIMRTRRNLSHFSRKNHNINQM